MLDFERVYMSIEGHNRMRGGDITSGRVPVYKEQFLKHNNLICFNHTKLVHHSFSEGGFERRKK